MQSVIVLFGIGMFAVIAYCDVRTRRIPNELAIAVAVLGLLRITLAGNPGAAVYTLGASVAVFAATFLLFWRGLLGGGDVKLVAATVLLVGHHDLLGFLLVMSVSGALLALAVCASHKLALRRATVPSAYERHETASRLTVPYGVAIAAAGILTLLLQSFSPG